MIASYFDVVGTQSYSNSLQDKSAYLTQLQGVYPTQPQGAYLTQPQGDYPTQPQGAYPPQPQDIGPQGSATVTVRQQSLACPYVPVLIVTFSGGD